MAFKKVKCSRKEWAKAVDEVKEIKLVTGDRPEARQDFVKNILIPANAHGGRHAFPYRSLSGREDGTFPQGSSLPMRSAASPWIRAHEWQPEKTCIQCNFSAPMSAPTPSSAPWQ